MRRFAVLVFWILLCSCGYETQTREFSERRPEWAAEIAAYPAETFSQDGLAQLYSNTTTLDFSFAHGTQVAHLSKDRTVYLWYPGNESIVTGLWKTEAPAAGSEFARICFQYPPNSYNPVTKDPGGSFVCQAGDLYVIYEDERVAGDPFELSTGRLPFILSTTTEYSMAQLRLLMAR